MAAGETSPPLIRTGEEWALSISRDRTDYVLSHNLSLTATRVRAGILLGGGSCPSDCLFTECHGALPCARGRPRRLAAPARRAGAGADQDIGGRDYLVADTGWVSRSGIDGELRGVPQAGRGSVWPTIWSPK
jgi:hypothetical protein